MEIPDAQRSVAWRIEKMVQQQVQPDPKVTIQKKVQNSNNLQHKVVKNLDEIEVISIFQGCTFGYARLGTQMIQHVGFGLPFPLLCAQVKSISARVNKPGTNEIEQSNEILNYR